MRITHIARAITSVLAAAILMMAGVRRFRPRGHKRNCRHCTSDWAAPTALPRWSTISSSGSSSTPRSMRIQRSARRGRECRRAAQVSRHRARVRVTGGPCKYTGRTMKEAHQHLNITQAQWDAMVADFKTTLDKFKVPQSEQQELITIVGSTKNDIVRPSGASQQ